MSAVEQPPVTGSGHLAALASLDRVGPARMRWLAGLGDPEHVWQLVASGRLKLGSAHRREATTERPPPRIEPGLLQRWSREASSDRDRPTVMHRRLDELGVDLLVEGELPSFLRSEPEPPGVLFCSGRPPTDLGPTVAIVGTRRASSYGMRIAHQLGRELSENGVTVVSGLALGIDAAAHAGALEGGCPVVAVIGAGHDRPCPRRNRSIAAEVSSRGLMVSEVPPGVTSAPWRFPVRNRLIAAFSQVVVVVESASRGGSMSTVGEALLRDRAVMAVPGPLGRSASEGCHDLLRDGAEICTSADDVISMLRTGADKSPGFDATRAARSDPTRARFDRGSAAGKTSFAGGNTSSAAANDSGTVGPAGPQPPKQRTVAADAVSAKPLGDEILNELAESTLSLDTVVLRCGASLGEVSAAIAQLELEGSVVLRGGWLERRL
ncbi:MAG: DNA-processing protein DprA [Microthrixaceae bacterium]